MYNVTFRSRHSYEGRSSGITVPIELGYGEKRVQLAARIDTGADYCLFQRGYGEAIGIQIESGEKASLATLSGPLTAYGHEVSVKVAGMEFQLVAYFPALAEVRRCLLGRQGWLSRVRLGVVDHDQLLYLSHYDD